MSLKPLTFKDIANHTVIAILIRFALFSNIEQPYFKNKVFILYKKSFCNIVFTCSKSDSTVQETSHQQIQRQQEAHVNVRGQHWI